MANAIRSLKDRALGQDGPKAAKNRAVRNAVHQHKHLSKQGILERAFTFAFRGLVYAQIWEDPAVDMEALAITPDSHVVTIASGGCNMMSYLTANPRAITAVDLNTAHIALNKLKLVAARHLPDYAAFHRFFAQANSRENVLAYRTYIRPHLDETTLAYWEGRDVIGRRRIGGFAKNVYKRGLLGNFIGVAHLLARLNGVNPKILLTAQSIEEQREIFDRDIAPFFDKGFIKWITDQPRRCSAWGSRPRNMKRWRGTRKWPWCCANGWKSWPAISTSGTIISLGKPLGGAMATGRRRPCRPICNARIMTKSSRAPNGSKCGTPISPIICAAAAMRRSTGTSCSMRRTG